MKKENMPIVVTGIVSGTIILLALLSLFIFVPMSTSTQDTVTVQGTSTVKVTPDLVSVYFNIQTNGSTPSVASDANNEIYTNLKDALIALGFNESQIGTQYFSVNPNYEYNNGKRTSNGYTAIHTVTVEMSANNTDLLGKTVDAGIAADAGVSSIDFELSPALQSTYKNQAIKDAAQDARTKVDAVALGFSKSVGKLVNVNVDNYNYVPWVMYSGAGTVAEASTVKSAADSITPSTQDVTATVSATYKLF